jgi:hypothetical protein
MNAPQRRYVSTEGFAKLLKETPSGLDASGLAVLSPVSVEIKALGGRDSRLIEFIITSDRVDREQDTLAVDGWDFKDYEDNPVVLWAHDHYTPPIANSRSLSPSKGVIKSIAEFTPEDLNPFGYMIYRMYAERFMHAVSVGFQPIEFTYAADRKYGVNYLKQGLLEYSCVPVPANPDAIAIARSKGINTAPLRHWAEQVLDDSRSGPTALTDDARRRVEVLRAASSPSGRALILELGDMKMTGSEKAETPPATTVKKIERWECGMAGHVHEDEASATECADFSKSADALVTASKTLLALVKRGRELEKTAADELRAVVKELAPDPAPVAEDPPKEGETTEEEAEGLEIEEPEGEDGDEKGLTFEFTEEDLRAAVTSAVDEKLKQVTGRVD